MDEYRIVIIRLGQISKYKNIDCILFTPEFKAIYDYRQRKCQFKPTNAAEIALKPSGYVVALSR